MEINGLMIKRFIYVAIIFMLGVSALSVAEEEKRIALECKLLSPNITMYKTKQPYKLCISEMMENLQSEFPGQDISMPPLFESTCLLEFTHKTEFYESFVVDKEVSNLSRSKDGSRVGSHYWWDFKELYYVKATEIYENGGLATFYIDRTDLSYTVMFEPKSGGDDYFANGQCSLLKEDERKI
jgi:hypothetical protein